MSPLKFPVNLTQGEAMKKLQWFGLPMLVLMPVSMMAQNAFDGTWKIDLNKAQFPKKPDVYLLQNGSYACKSCAPTYEVKADGTDQKVSGHPYFDTVSIKVVDANTVEETDKKAAKTVATSKSTVSPDGNTLTFVFTDSSATNADPVTGKGEETRVAKGPAGSHAISGSWRTTKMESVSDNGLQFTYKLSGDSLTMTNPTGQTYTAKLDGPEAAYKGDPGTSSVLVKRIGKDTIEETDKRDGKVISVARMTVSPDGKTMTIKVSDKLHDSNSEFVAIKQ
jgi:hypothetical protein